MRLWMGLLSMEELSFIYKVELIGNPETVIMNLDCPILRSPFR